MISAALLKDSHFISESLASIFILACHAMTREEDVKIDTVTHINTMTITEQSHSFNDNNKAVKVKFVIVLLF